MLCSVELFRSECVALVSPYRFTVEQLAEGRTAQSSWFALTTPSGRDGMEDVMDGNATRLTSSSLPPLPLHRLDELIVSPAQETSPSTANPLSSAYFTSAGAGVYGDGLGAAIGEEEVEDEELGDSDTEDEDEVEGVLFTGGERLVSTSQRRSSRATSDSDSSVSLSSDDEDESEDDEEYELGDDHSEEQDNDEEDDRSDGGAEEDSDNESKSDD